MPGEHKQLGSGLASKAERVDLNAAQQSGGGPPQSKMLARIMERWSFRQVLEYGDMSPLFDLADMSARSKARSCPRGPN